MLKQSLKKKRLLIKAGWQCEPGAGKSNEKNFKKDLVV